ncbi:alpha/beta hydrolase [Nocardia abscessus]|uniref:alpha/beta hydrolase n=1 Tax=Nocardia abscessus TaxID=120957 RepID=UPI0024545305|nr:alpha/beta hydrolase [Nocardia abscessus]
MSRPRFYRDQAAWRELQQFLPATLRMQSEADMPYEEFWRWGAHNIHLDRYPNPDAPAKVVLHHGVGTNGRQMNLILGKPLAERGWEVVALDNLGYGMTEVGKATTPGYRDWVQMVTDYIAYEKSRDDRPIVLYGLSAGGMLTYHVAAHAPRGTVDGIVGMTFLDQRNPHVWRQTCHDPFHATAGTALFGLLARTPLRDKTSAGNWVSAKFITEYHRYAPDIEPADFDICPILHTQPAQDRWTPLDLSYPALDPITKVPVTTITLDNAGHYPLEEPGLTQMQDTIHRFVQQVTGTTVAHSFQ